MGKDCSSPGKHPKTKNGLKDASTDIEQIKKWWPKESVLPSNIGIVTGSDSGLVVVDIDGDEGFETLGSKRDSLEGAPCVKTGRGFHYYFKSEVPVKTKTGFNTKVDIKGNGGYIVAPPSKHSSGSNYQWELPINKEIPYAPSWVLDSDSTQRNSHETNQVIEIIPEGQRNDTLFRLACSLTGKKLDYNTVLIILQYENKQKCNPPLPDQEVEGIVKSAFKYETEARVTEVTEVTVTPENVIQILDFPIDVFPVELKNFVLDVSKSVGISYSVTGSMVIAILGAAIGNSIRISPKPTFEVSPFLWMCIVLATGSGKSPLQDLLTKPVKQKQAATYKRYKNELKQYQIELRAFKKNKIDEIPNEPIFEHFIIQDTTVEGLTVAFESQPRGLLSIQDELSGWLLGMNQYKSSGNDRQSYLQLFNSNSWSINRKSGVKFIASTGLGLIGNIQPEMIPLIFENESFADGLIQRILFVYPDTPPMKFYRGSAVITNEFGFVVPKILKLEKRTLDIYEAFYNEYGCLASILPSRYRGFISKLFLYCLKIAGILHVVGGFENRAFSNVISEETITNAIEIVKFHFGQIRLILKLYKKTKTDTLNESQKKLIQILYDKQGEVENGKLKLEKITDKYNEGLPANFQLTPETVAGILNNELGLVTRKSTGNHSYLIWEIEKLKKYFKQTVTTVTQNPEKQGMSVNEVIESNENKGCNVNSDTESENDVMDLSSLTDYVEVQE